jgi:hypothetical protein
MPIRPYRVSAKGRATGQAANEELAVFLMSDYKLCEPSAALLESHLPNHGAAPAMTLFEAISISMDNSIYKKPAEQKSFSDQLYAAFPIAICEWMNVVTYLGDNLEKVEQHLAEVDAGSLDAGARESKLAGIRGCVDQHLHHPRFYESMLNSLKATEQSLSECQLLSSRLKGASSKQIDVDLIHRDISFLRRHLQHAQQDTDSFVSWRDSLISSVESEKQPRGKENRVKENRGNEKISTASSAPDLTKQTGTVYAGAGTDVGVRPLIDDPRPPHRRPPHKYPLDEYANALWIKLDQIAYATNTLLSLSFIATVYGMNLNMFSTGGMVELRSFLATALPFTLVVFVLTFGAPPLISRVHQKRGNRQAAFNIEVA